MQRILFVDDEPKVLDGLKRMLHGMRREWEMVFANSGQEALEILGTKPFDVLISDMRMPGMDGYQLLEKVRELHPQVVRIIPGQGFLMQSLPPSFVEHSVPSSRSTTGSTPKNGRLALPGLSVCAPGSGLMRMPPVSVCHHVSTMGQRPLPMTR